MDKIRDAVAAGRTAFGSWVTFTDTVSAEIIGKVGFEFVILDAQHGAVTWDKMLHLIQAVDLGGTPAMVRVGWNDPALIGRAMDLGAAGVVVPMVSNRAQAEAAAQAVRHPPAGIRSFGAVRSHYAVPNTPARDPVCMVMIETAEAMENLESIATTPGVDGLYVGPVDLALSMGLGAALQMPDPVFEACGRVVDICRSHGKISGCASLGAPNAKALTERGMRFLTITADSGLIRRGAAADLAQAKAWLQPA